MNLELRHLKVVCAIAETGSVTKAASMLGLAQPALTAQLQRIERTLGGPLFERDRRGARPTALGQLVLARARVLLPAMKGLQDEAARLAGTGTGPAMSRYRIGAVGGPIVGGLVHRLSQDQPDAQITLHSSWHAEELAQMVMAGKLDYALVGVCGEGAPPAEFGLAWRPVAVDAVGVLLPSDHPLAQAHEVKLADLAMENWVGSPGNDCFTDCFAAACARAGFTPQRIFETDVRGCVDMVESGGAVCICQPTFRPPPGLVNLPLAGAPLSFQQVLGWHPDSAAAAMAGRLLEYATAAYLDTVSRNPGYVEWLQGRPRFGVQHIAAA